MIDSRFINDELEVTPQWPWAILKHDERICTTDYGNPRKKTRQVSRSLFRFEFGLYQIRYASANHHAYITNENSNMYDEVL
jgi:hypothetical protein